METPFFDHLNLQDYEKVYKPAEDTFLLLDALESDLQYLEEVLKPTTCLEIGSGSGILSTAISKQLKHCFCIATDINSYACIATKKTKIRNQVEYLDSVNMNLTNGFRAKIFDLIIFNPPYVVTSDEECLNKTDNSLNYSWAGGSNGRLIINKFLNNLDRILSNIGTAYLLLLKENNPNVIMKELKDKKFKSSILIERKIIGEHLFVIKILR